MKVARAFALPLVVLVCGVLLVVSHRNLERATRSPMEKEKPLYMPEVSYLKFISLGHDMLIADVVLAKALTYYGSNYRNRGTFTFKYLKKLLVTALEMDPRNKDAFLMGGNLLADINVDDALDLLKLGMKYHPGYWKFPEMIGFNYFYRLKNDYKAAHYYEMASHLPGHPPYVPSLSGKFYRKSGRYEDALRVLNNFYITTKDKKLKESFKEYIRLVERQYKEKRYRLNAEIVEVVDGDTLRFRAVGDNPGFSVDTGIRSLQVVGVNAFNLDSKKEVERLQARFQVDFAHFILDQKTIRIEFLRRTGGRLQVDRKGRFLGIVYLDDYKTYQQEAIKRGILKPNYNTSLRKELVESFKQAAKQARNKAGGVYDLPPQNVPYKDLLRKVGCVITTVFRVHKVNIGPEEVILDSASQYRNVFSVAVPKAYWRYFPGGEAGCVEYFKSLERTQVRVYGFNGYSGKRARLIIYDPSQLCGIQ
ncbi:MAG: hypothetical protein GY765_35460 [bacterium]|nr:hypothetical protein [bacterium]